MAESTFTLKGYPLHEVSPGIWRLEPTGKMRVGVHLVGSRALLARIADDRSVDQARNVACLPGVMDPVLTMPDIHQGYGFPIGGVAAFRTGTGVVSPGGVGYDINCGIRLLKTSLQTEDLVGKKALRAFVDELFAVIPCGVGSKRGDLDLSDSDLDDVLQQGAAWAVARGFGTREDLDCIEENGCLRGAGPDKVSARARERGQNQLGTLGSGNHFVEVQYIDDIRDEAIAAELGLRQGQIVISIHTGSRGLGYQVCSDYLEAAIASSKKYGFDLPDRELAAAPLDSAEGKSYLQAMAAAANFAFANRQVITHWVRGVLSDRFPGASAELLYDVCHNIAKFEDLPVGRQTLTLCVHRKGATRAYPPKHPKVPPRYRETGQPILIPGDMGRASYVLVGKKGSLETTWGSACHGAGRELSRSEAKRRGKDRASARELEEQGIFVRSAGRNTVIEEMPEAYKDVSEVVGAVEVAGIAGIVARLRPIGVIKG
jgi:tRNA-splicing ligase RtcB